MRKKETNKSDDRNTEYTSLSEFKSEMGQRLREKREEAGLSQEVVGNRAGMTGGNLSAIENGRSSIKAETILALAQILKMTPNEILGYPENLSGEDLLSGCSVAEKYYLQRVIRFAKDEYTRLMKK